ncbi:MAG: hypothetical protein QOH96_1088 [Blastocatellia bacterium]|nr:hypothetical protein [Blastocatellia bacterium]
MKLISVFFLSIGLSAIGFAQNSPESPPSDLIVLKSSWNRSVESDFSDGGRRNRDSVDVENSASNAGFDRRMPSNELLTRGGDAKGGYVYTARVKVTGPRALASVQWTITFLDPGTHSEVGRHTFITKRKLKPGDEVDLSQFSKIPPATILDARRGEVPSEKNLINKVTIKKVEYVDDQATNDKK